MNQPNVKKNYIYRLSYEILNMLVPLITAPYISRVLGPDRIGIFSYTYSIITYFMMFAALGTATYGSREIARHRDDRQTSSRLFWEIELMTMCTSAVCLAGWGALIWLDGANRPYFLALSPYLMGTMLDISWYFGGHEQFQRLVLRNALCKIAGAAAMLLLVKGPEDLLTYFLVNSLVMMLGNLSLWTYLPGMLVKVPLRSLSIRRHFRATLVYFIPSIAISIYTMVDRTLIGLITRDRFQNGYYEQTQKIVDIGKTFVFGSVNAVMGARISYLFTTGAIEEIHRRLERSMNFILLVGFAFVMGVTGVAERFVPAFFGPGYQPVTVMVCMLVPVVLIIGVSSCLDNHYFIPSGQQKRSARLLLVGAAFNCAADLLLIPFFGAKGAIVASVGAETVIAALYLRAGREYMTLGRLWRMAWKRLLAGGVMCLAVWLLGRWCPLGDAATVVLQIPLGAVVYLGLLLVLRDSMLRELLAMARGIVQKLLRRGGAA